MTMYSAADWFIDGFVFGLLFGPVIALPYLFGWGPADGLFHH
jgi:hypothetical protein